MRSHSILRLAVGYAVGTAVTLWLMVTGVLSEPAFAILFLVSSIPALAVGVLLKPGSRASELREGLQDCFPDSWLSYVLYGIAGLFLGAGLLCPSRSPWRTGFLGASIVGLTFSAIADHRWKRRRRQANCRQGL